MNRDLAPPPLTTYRDDPPALLEATTMAALAKDPAARPRDGAALLDALAGVSAEEATRVLPVAGPATGAAAAATTVSPAPEPPRSRVPLLVAGLLVLLLAGGALAYELSRPASSSTPPAQTVPSITLPKATTTRETTTRPTTASTTEPTTSTAGTTTQASTQQQTTTARTTTQAPPTTTGAPPPTTTAPPPPTTTIVPTTTDGLGTTVTAP
jgi:hypothetical protein